jgi:pre-mRNA-splicing factor ATP-dependent RNA helicase DHX15/PRP43
MSDMAGKRASAESDEPSRKKAKKGDSDGDVYNPYLAHMDPSSDSPFSGMTRRQVTAEQISKVEDLSTNAFTGVEHTQKYFQILRTRRDLPVHKQRYVVSLISLKTLPVSFLRFF